MLRRLKNDPQAGDYSPTELKAMQKRRAESNQKYMAVIRGESRVIPDFENLNIPGTMAHPYTLNLEAEREFEASVKYWYDTFRGADEDHKNKLQQQGVTVARGRICDEFVEQYFNRLKQWLEFVEDLASKHEDLFHCLETRQLCGASLMLGDLNLTIFDVIQKQPA